jgi:hypothetical protein
MAVHTAGHPLYAASRVYNRAMAVHTGEVPDGGTYRGKPLVTTVCRLGRLSPLAVHTAAGLAPYECQHLPSPLHTAARRYNHPMAVHTAGLDGGTYGPAL